jgi:hypothetical protein
MRLGREGIAGSIGLAVSLVLLPQAYGLPKLPIVPVGPGFYPTIVLIFLALTSGTLLVQDVLAHRRAGAVGAPSADGPSRAYGLVAAAFLLIAGYVVLLPLVGFRIATVLFVAEFQFVLERPSTLRQWATQTAVAVGTAVLTYLVFQHYLLVLLPRGIWINW